jgi:hypothetical protein
MHNRFPKDKFVAISVALDEREGGAKQEEKRKAILSFLERTNATLTNLWLEEPMEVWQEKLNVVSPPCAYVFDRDGHFVKKLFDSEFNPTVAENLVDELLKK